MRYMNVPSYNALTSKDKHIKVTRELCEVVNGVEVAMDDVSAGIAAETERAEDAEAALASDIEDLQAMEQIVIDGGEAQIAQGSDFTDADATKRAKVPTVGAILDGLNDGVYDVSARNGGATFESLSALLSSNNLSTLIPTSWRKGGMSIRFVQSSDNKYVQYRLMKNQFSLSEADWQGVTSDVKAGSRDLVESGGVYDELNYIESETITYLKINGASVNIYNNKIIGDLSTSYRVGYVQIPNDTKYTSLIVTTVDSIDYSYIQYIGASETAPEAGTVCTKLDFTAFTNSGNTVKKEIPIESVKGKYLLFSYHTYGVPQVKGYFCANKFNVIENEIDEVRGRIGNLESDVDTLKYKKLVLLENKYFNTHDATLPIDATTLNGIYCAVYEVTPGEKYKITGLGGNDYTLLWATSDSNRSKLRYAGTSYNARTNPVELTINEGEAYLYCNLSSYDSETDKVEKQIYIMNEITELQEDVSDIDNIKYRKPKLYTADASPNYEQYVQEAYIVSLPSGSTYLKCYNNEVFVGRGSVVAKASLSGVQNGDVVVLKIYTTNDTTNYPIGKVAGYVVFSDVSGFSSISNPGTTAKISRPVAENVAYSPTIYAYLSSQNVEATETIEVCLPSVVYAVVGDTLQLFYRSIFRCVEFEKYAVSVSCDIGAQYPKYYEVTPLLGNVGTHNITFTIKDNNNNIIGTKKISLVVVNAPQAPLNELNVLCVGASGTQDGQWASEMKRRLLGDGGNPAGNNLSNIQFVGRKSVTFDGKQVNLEATGGYKFSSYTNPNTTRYRFNVTAENEPVFEEGDVYANNGNNYTVVEINITTGEGGYFSCTGTGTPQASGTLTKVSGTGSSSIVYSSTSLSGNPFAYGGVIDMQQYADEYCNPQNAAHGKIDVVYTELLENGSSPYMDDFTTKMSEMQTFINQIKDVFPYCKFCIGISWNPDLKGGTGVNYGAGGGWSNVHGMRYTFMNMCNALQQYITDNNLSDYVYIVNWLNEFDEDNSMQQTAKALNTRYATLMTEVNAASSMTDTSKIYLLKSFSSGLTPGVYVHNGSSWIPKEGYGEIFGSNGIHPATIGYYQMADTAWRLFVAKFCQG